ncbi:MAG TPA: efflux RND transporter periplasmic adaptor subunit [Burkholderiales bacterium]|nr:efflux RND transporter periplasmic adaptor subunit [Burkholderiales bacterium]
MTIATRRLALVGLVAIVLAAAAGAYFYATDGRAARKEGAKPAAKGPQAVLITSAVVQARTLELYEEVVGTIENVIDPTIGAEVAGRVTRVAGYTGKKVKKGEPIAEIDAADFEIQARGDKAEIGRLTSLLDQQEKVVERQTKLVGQGFISQNVVDDTIAQRNALRQQLAAARARAEATSRGLTKSRVVAPVDGEIETQIVAIGDYVKVGDPLFKLVGVQQLRVHLLLPEAAATRIKPGLKVVLSPPAAPEQVLEARIDEIKPTLGVNNRALDAIVKISGVGNLFRGGGTVNARIVTNSLDGALMVPEQSVVLRPAGKVVYALEGNVARQRIVETGMRQDGLQQIVKGVAAGETIAADGAGFLTDGAAVTVRAPRGAEKGAAAKAKGEKGAPGG